MWIMHRIKGKKLHNSGMTLVELLLAFAVSAIILSGLSAMMFSALTMYGRTNANVDAQNEVQTALNLVLDSVMAAKGICLIEQEPESIGAGDSSVSLFGDLKIDEKNKTIAFDGDALFWSPGDQEMYLMTGTYDLGTFTDVGTAPAVAITAMKDLLPDNKEERLPYLMAKHVTAFKIKTMEDSFAVPTPTPDPGGGTPGKVKYYFKNPVTVQVTISVEIPYNNKTPIPREISDSASVRNNLEYIYVSRDSKGLVKYIRYQEPK